MTVTEVTQAYYDGADADAFYFHVWGGEDIHIGIYEHPMESIADASHRTVVRLAERLPLQRGVRMLDCGAGYGGAARWLASTHGVHVTCLNLSEVQNDRNRSMTTAAGLGDRIEVVGGAFENIPMQDASVDIVWAQDAILHSGDKPRVLQEIHRVLRPGGHFVFTDPMQSDECPPGVLGPILDRIHLESLGSFGFYSKQLESLGFVREDIVDLTPHLITHYTRVGETLDARRNELEPICGADYIGRMREGLRHWVDGGKKGHLAWGIIHYAKAAA